MKKIKTFIQKQNNKYIKRYFIDNEAENTLYILRGVYGSGKTTYVNSRFNSNKYTIVQINENSNINNYVELSVARRKVLEGLYRGKNIVIDGNNLSVELLELWIGIANEFDTSIEIINFITPIEECFNRIKYDKQKTFMLEQIMLNDKYMLMDIEQWLKNTTKSQFFTKKN